MRNTTNPTFELIKKQNGETFAQAIATYDNGIFDVPSIVDILKYAGRNAKPLLPYLESLKKIGIIAQGDYPDPFVLLHQAGYDAYYADTFEKQNAIYRYFEPGERLCTFDDRTRFRKFYIINAVREDAARINRENFRGKERREDSYGTSVLSIQISKSGDLISIKNRYNDTVENSDNTFGSNPDRIIPGLTISLLKYFKVDFLSKNIDLPLGYLLLDNKIIKYNYRDNDFYFGADFYVKDEQLFTLDKDKEFMLDNCIINLKDKTIRTPITTENSLKDILEHEFSGEKLSLTRISEKGYKISTSQGAVVEAKDGCITKLILPNTRIIGNGFMFETKCLTHLEAPSVEEIGFGFLGHNQSLRYLYLPQCRKIGGGGLFSNNCLQILVLPNVEELGVNFLRSNSVLKKEDTDLSKIKKLGKGVFASNPQLLSKFSTIIKSVSENKRNDISIVR